MVGIAAQLGATVTAEGIETEDQFAAVRQAGCTEVQGYLFGRPVPLDGTRAEGITCRRERFPVSRSHRPSAGPTSR